MCSNTGTTGSDDTYSRFEFVVGLGSLAQVPAEHDPFDMLHHFHQDKQDWLFGHFSYNLKDLGGKLTSRNPDLLGFPAISFHQPRYVITRNDGNNQLHYLAEHETEETLQTLEQELTNPAMVNGNSIPPVHLHQRTDRESYLERADDILRHIRRGDIYEMNYCMEFYAAKVLLDPVETFLKLNRNSPMPMSAFYRLKDRYLLCASPERFLQKEKNTIISQPIKGTIRRGTDKTEDELLKSKLQNSSKERSENVMITDLVRNDLSRSAKRGTVKVEELFGLKSYLRIHQLVTTISAEADPSKKWTDMIRDAFPMGSMTGAPKIRAMEIIEAQESMARGLYSGSVGYVTPDGDFDFNVVIRSIQYNAATQYVSAMAGSALTSECNPEEEYEECLLKMETMKKALS